jgi:hypothetical protein
MKIETYPLSDLSKEERIKQFKEIAEWWSMMRDGDLAVAEVEPSKECKDD